MQRFLLLNDDTLKIMKNCTTPSFISNDNDYKFKGRNIT